MKKRMLRDFLNEFELDWAQAPVRSELVPAGKIKGKKILLIGEQETLVRAVAWSFAAWNDSCSLGVCVESARPEDGGKTIPAKPEITVAQVYAGESFALQEADYVILTGYCCRKIPDTVQETVSQIRRFARMVDAVMSISCSRVLLLSDGRVYGKLDHAFAASEYEAGKTDPCAAGYEAQYFMQALEGVFLSAARDEGRAYDILRTGWVYGAYLEMMEHGVCRLAQITAKEQET